MLMGGSSGVRESAPIHLPIRSGCCRSRGV
nr:MAG TPA: hypothetical protein [Caudoviricetes sp.]